MPPNMGRVRIEAVETPEGVSLNITDDGCGISKGQRSAGIRAFFTTRRPSGGTGMGLAVVRNLLSAHRAGIRPATSRPTRFRITCGADPRT